MDFIFEKENLIDLISFHSWCVCKVRNHLYEEKTIINLKLQSVFDRNTEINNWTNARLIEILPVHLICKKVQLHFTEFFARMKTHQQISIWLIYSLEYLLWICRSYRSRKHIHFYFHSILNIFNEWIKSGRY